MEQGWLNDENDLNRSQTKNVKINKLYFVRCKKRLGCAFEGLGHAVFFNLFKTYGYEKQN